MRWSEGNAGGPLGALSRAVAWNTDVGRKSAHNRKADMAQRTPGALSGEALRTTGFPACETRKPGRYAIDVMYALPPRRMIRYPWRKRKGYPAPKRHTKRGKRRISRMSSISLDARMRRAMTRRSTRHDA